MPQSLSNLLIHLILSTKHRRPFLAPQWIPELERYSCQILRDLRCPDRRFSMPTFPRCGRLLQFPTGTTGWSCDGSTNSHPSRMYDDDAAAKLTDIRVPQELQYHLRNFKWPRRPWAEQYDSRMGARRVFPQICELDIQRQQNPLFLNCRLCNRDIRRTAEPLVEDRTDVEAQRHQGILQSNRQILVQLEPHPWATLQSSSRASSAA